MLSRASTSRATSTHVRDARLAVLAAARVDEHDALVEVGEVHTPALQHHVPGRVATAQQDARRAGVEGLGDQLGRDAHHVRRAVDEAAAVREDVERFGVLHEHAGALEDLQSRGVQVVQISLREDRKAQAAAALAAGRQIAFHDCTSVARPRPSETRWTGRERGSIDSTIITLTDTGVSSPTPAID